MNKELWEKAVEFHGHQCVGLALGFRMGEEAKRIFGTNAEIYCKIPSKNCITDGITVTTGASLEFPGGKDPVAATLACDRDFLFTIEPCDMD